MATKTQPRQRRPPARYSWKSGTRQPVRAAVAAVALEKIRRRDGSITPAAVVEEARDPDHPLHAAFTWDDTEAAERWREQQARVLINSVRVLVEAGDETERQVAFVSVNVRESGRGYLPTSMVMSDDEYRNESLADALAALQGWRRRYGHLRELSTVFEAADAVMASAARTK